MKTLFFIPTLIVLIGIFSCQKEVRDPGVASVIKDSTAAVDTAKIKVWHGARIKGVAPKSTNGSSAPVIASPTDTFIHAFAGRFAIIKPVVTSGNVAGYYVTIKGASDYFKVDYTKPLLTERGMGKTNNTHARHSGFGFRPMGVQGDSFVDSAIVLILPPNLTLPDTICVTYLAYDYSGNISGSVTSCIIVSKVGGDASTAWLQAGWRFNYYYETSASGANYVYDTVPYNKWVAANDYHYSYIESNGPIYYFCNTISPGLNQVSSIYIDTARSKYLPSNNDSDYVLRLDVIFNNNGGLNVFKSHKESRVDSTTSTCDSLKYSTTTYEYKQIGAWSITGDKLIMVLEFDQKGFPDYEIYEYSIKRISDSEIWLVDPIETGFGSYEDYIKL